MKLKKWHWPVTFAIAVLALSGYWLMQEWLGPAVEGYPVVREELIQTIDASGKVELPADVEVVSKYHGKVVEIKVAQGEAVSAGQVLLILENKIDRGALDRARAATAQADARFRKISEHTQAGSEQSLSRAKSALDKAKKQYTRASELAAKGFVSQEQAADALRSLTIAQSQINNAQFQAKAMRAKGSDYALAETSLNKARANEKAVREKIGTHAIKAEAGGVLLASKVSRGDVVVPGKTLMLLTPSAKPRLLVQVDEKNMHDLKPGQLANVVADAHPEQRFNAALSYINPVADSASSTVELRFEADNPPDYLVQDMKVSLSIEVSRRVDGLSVPVEAIRHSEGAQPWVMVVDNGRAHRRAVKLGARGKEKIEILEGLREGDFVLSATGAAVGEGHRLRLAKAG